MFVELEAIALRREIPVAVRFAADPLASIVRLRGQSSGRQRRKGGLQERATAFGLLDLASARYPNARAC